MTTFIKTPSQTPSKKASSDPIFGLRPVVEVENFWITTSRVCTYVFRHIISHSSLGD